MFPSSWGKGGTIHAFIMKRTITILILALLAASITSFAQDRDSIRVGQYVLDSFTRYGVPETFITLCDTNGILIDTMTVRNARLWNDQHKTQEWQRNVARKAQTFLVKAEHPDYETTVMRVELKSPARRESFWFPELLMKRKMRETTMEEVKVTATRIQLTYKGDTLVVDAGAFRIPDGSMLDALVRRVPGAELSENGTITMNGRKVDYLTLNGKDFFKGKNRIMLDNLPHYMVSHLKFYEKDVPLNKRVHADTGEKDYVMDVELKPEFSVGYTANVEGGYGTNDRWVGRLFGLRFTDNSRMTLFGGANNTNEIAPPSMDGFNSWSQPDGEKVVRRVGFGLNVDDKRGRYTDNLEGYVNWTDSKAENRTSRETFLPEGNTFSRSQNATSSKDFGADLNNEWDLKKMGLTFNTSANYNQHDGRGLSRSATFTQDPSAFGSCVQVLDSLFDMPISPMLQSLNINKVFDQSKYDQKGYAFGQRADWNKTLPWGDELWVYATGEYNNDQKDEFSQYRLNYKDGIKPNDNQDRFLPYRHHGYLYSTEARYMVNLLDNWRIVLDGHYTQRYSHTQSDRYRLDMLDTDLEFGLLPSQVDYLRTLDAGNSYRNLYLTRTQEHQFGFIKNLSTNRHNMTIGAGTFVEGKNESVRYWRNLQNYSLSQNNWYVNPYLSYRHGIKGDKFRYDIRMDYNTRVQTPNLVQKLNMEDASNPMAITLGNPDLKLSRSHTVSVLLGRFNAKHYVGIATSFRAQENQVASSFNYNPQTGAYTYRPENVNGNWSEYTTLRYWFYVDKARRFRVGGDTKFDYVHNVDLARIEGYNESRLSRVRHYNPKQGVNASYEKESLRLEFTGAFSWHRVESELKQDADMNGYDFDYGISGQYTLPWKIQLSTSLKMFSRRGYDEPAMNSDELMWDAQISRSFLGDKLQVRLVGQDLLNQKCNYRYTIDGQGRTEQWTLYMPSFLMLRVSYKFNKTR